MVVEDCKWIKLSNGAVLEAQPTYQKDLVRSTLAQMSILLVREYADKRWLDAPGGRAVVSERPDGEHGAGRGVEGVDWLLHALR